MAFIAKTVKHYLNGDLLCCGVLVYLSVAGCTRVGLFFIAFGRIQGHSQLIGHASHTNHTSTRQPVTLYSIIIVQIIHMSCMNNMNKCFNEIGMIMFGLDVSVYRTYYERVALNGALTELLYVWTCV